MASTELRAAAQQAQPEALRLADALDFWPQSDCSEAAAELRRLYAQRDALLEALKLALRQNEHDMLMTGEELRQCRAAIAKAEGNHD